MIRWRPPLWLVLAITTVSFSLGAWSKLTCTDQYRGLCYSDISALYLARGFFDGVRVYLEQGGGRFLEYPVITGTVMQLAGWVAGSGGDWEARTRAFLIASSVLLLAFALMAVTALWFTRGTARWMRVGDRTEGVAGPVAALMVAASPAMLLDSTINWDLIAVAFTCLALFAWSREAPVWTGAFIGLGAAAKLYPALLLLPVVVICARDRRWNQALQAVVAAGVAWLAANLPVMALSPAGWKEFYEFSQTRGIDFGSGWLAASLLGYGPFTTSHVNTWSMLVFLAACAGIALLGYRQRGATLAQLGFLVVAAFVLVNKVYSPQYVLWLVPLAALARPKWPAFLVWQAGEVLYFVAIWRYLLGYGVTPKPEGSIGDPAYVGAIAVHMALTLGYAALVVRDALREPEPAREPVPVPA